MWLFVSTFQSPSTCPAEDRPRPRNCGSRSPLVDRRVVVSPSTLHVFTQRPTPALSAACGVSRASGTDPSYEELDSRSLVDQLTLHHVSSATRATILAKHAAATRRSYDPRFQRFLDFCRARDMEPAAPGLVTILDFLQSRLEAGLKYSTLKADACALRDAYVYSPVRDLFDSQVFHDFLRGCERSAPPPTTNAFVWNPEIPLQMLFQRPRPEEFLPAAREAIFLFLLATALRVSDVDRLSCRFTDRGTTGLEFPYLEKRKTRVRGKYCALQLLPPLRSSNPAMSRLCPVRAIRHYLALAASIRTEGVFALFVHSKGGKATMLTLRRWVCDVLSDAGIKATAGSCRSASSSLAFFRGVSLDRITASAGWSSSAPFREFYCRPVYSQPVVLFESPEPERTD